MARRFTQLIREGNFAAEVPIELIDEADGWSPYVAEADVLKLDRVRRGDVAAGSREARVFELTPLSA